MSKASGSIDLKSLKVAGEGASKYITAIDGDGIKVHAENNINANYSLINADGMEIFQGDTAADSVSVAKFGVITRIGNNASANISIDEDSITGAGEDGKSFFRFANSNTQLTTKLSDLVYSGNGRRFPTTNASGLQCTLTTTPDASSEIDIDFKLKKENEGSKRCHIYFTQGVADTKSQSVTYQGSTYTLYATYNGGVKFTKIHASSNITDMYSIECNIRYLTSVLAPSFKIGEDVAATGGLSYAEGKGTTASGNYSHAEGRDTTASGLVSHAEGSSTIASGAISHAEGGDTTTASGNYSHAEGRGTQALGPCTHAEGYGTQAGINSGGEYCHAEGWNTKAIDTASHAEGYETEASGVYSHGEGSYTKATMSYSHAEGRGTTASGSSSHAEGYHTTASGRESHAEGNTTTASGVYSHASGNLTTANGRSQTVIGECNVADTTSLFIIGNGQRPLSDDSTATYSNALTVDWNGNIDIASGASYKINGTSLIDIFYPIGSYYETSDTTFDPNTAWGGTWSLETEGLVHIGAGSTYTVGDTGGSKDAIIPYHRHSVNAVSISSSGGHTHTINAKYTSERLASGTARTQYYASGENTSTGMATIASNTGTHTHSVPSHNTEYAGTSGNLTNANMQPYIVVNRWHRTA